MKPITTLLAIMALFVGIFLTTIASLMYGWGLQPRSWKWIVGMFLAQMTLHTLVKSVIGEDKK